MSKPVTGASIHVSNSSSPSSLSCLSHSENAVVITTRWTSLKDDHLFSISLYLSPEDAANASAVCKLRKQSLYKPDVWKKQREIQGYAPMYIHPTIEECLQGSDGS